MNNIQISKILSLIFIFSSIIYGLSSVFVNTFPFLSICKIFFGFFILTYIIGATLRIFLRDALKFSRLPSTLSIGGISCDILLSMIINIIFSVLLAKSFLFNEVLLNFILISFIIILNCLVYFHGVSSSHNNTSEIFITKKAIFDFVFPCVILLVSAILLGNHFRNQTPFPMISGWDMNSSLAYINWITTHHGFDYILVPSFPSGGTPYPAFFFFLVSSYHFVLGISSYQVFWYSVFPIIFGYIFLIFLIAFKFSKNLLLSLNCSFIAFFLSVAAAEIVRNPLYLTLDMVSQLIFLLIILFNITTEYSRGKYFISLIAILFLTLFNFFAVIAIFPFLLWILMGEKKLRFLGNGRKVFKISIILTALFASTLIAVVSYLFPAVSYMFSASAFPLSLKLQTFTTIYPLYFWALFVLALFAVFAYRRTAGKGLSYFDLLLFIMLGLFLYFMPAWVTYRFEFYIRIFLVIFISGIALLLNKGIFRRSINISLKGRYTRKLRLGVIVSFCLLIITIISLYPLFSNYSPFAYISKDEYNAALWLNSNTPSNSYLITDPSSGYVLRGLALRNASSYFILPDGRMPADSFSISPTIVDDTANFFYLPTPSTWAQLSIQKSNSYLVITSRTVYWAANSFVDNALTHPMEGVNFSLVTDKLEPQYFHEVYSSNTIKIYQLDFPASQQNK